MSLEKICKVCLAYMNPDRLVGWLRCPSCGFCKKTIKSMISIDEILMGRATLSELPEELQKNVQILLERVNKFRQIYGKPMIVNSGYRRPEDNAAANGSPTSPHMLCMACDFKDNDGALKQYVKDNPSVLETCDLYQEDPASTPTWIHLDIRKRDNRIFKP
jgi:zinc D-Ala-D-Ala carboxypeptidase